MSKFLKAKRNYSETFQRKDFISLCMDIKHNKKTVGFDNIRQWLSDNKHDNERLKDAVTCQGCWNMTPLQRLLERDPPLDIIETIIKLVPETLQMKDDFGCLPIHSACNHRASLAVVQALVFGYPRSVTVRNKRDELPHDVACLSECMSEVVNFLLASYNESIDLSSDLLRLTYHVAEEDSSYQSIDLIHQDGKASADLLKLTYYVEKKDSTYSLQELLNGYPDSIKEKDYYGRLPLHAACYGGAPLEHIQALLNGYPESVKITDNDGRLPLDLLNANKTDSNGMLPLHHACKDGNSLILIHSLFQAYPECSSVLDNDGKSALQYFKETASRIDKRGMVLLHRQAAYSKCLSDEILSLLVDAYPDATRLQDKSGLLPIHYACLNEASSLEALMILIKLFPESIAV